MTAILLASAAPLTPVPGPAQSAPVPPNSAAHSVAAAVVLAMPISPRHSTSMPGSTGAGLAGADKDIVAEVGRSYDSNQHLRNDAAHTAALTGEFIDRFAVTGPPDRVIERLKQLTALGIDRFVVTGPGFGADRDDAHLATQLLTTEVLPALA